MFAVFKMQEPQIIFYKALQFCRYSVMTCMKT